MIQTDVQLEIRTRLLRCCSQRWSWISFAQSNLPVHFIHEYLRPDRSFLAECRGDTQFQDDDGSDDDLDGNISSEYTVDTQFEFEDGIDDDWDDNIHPEWKDDDCYHSYANFVAKSTCSKIYFKVTNSKLPRITTCTFNEKDVSLYPLTAADSLGLGRGVVLARWFLERAAAMSANEVWDMKGNIIMATFESIIVDRTFVTLLDEVRAEELSRECESLHLISPQLNMEFR